MTRKKRLMLRAERKRSLFQALRAGVITTYPTTFRFVRTGAPKKKRVSKFIKPSTP